MSYDIQATSEYLQSSAEREGVSQQGLQASPSPDHPKAWRTFMQCCTRALHKWPFPFPRLPATENTYPNAPKA